MLTTALALLLPTVAVAHSLPHKAGLHGQARIAFLEEALSHHRYVCKRGSPMLRTTRWHCAAKVWVRSELRQARRHAYRTLTAVNSWPAAVQVAQRPYPGTAAWLLSCSGSEGGHGRWVPNGDGSGAGGWLQFLHGTFYRMWAAAYADVRSRGFIVPRSAHSWYSPLGQALAGAWGLVNGRRHEWYGPGC